MIRVSFCVLISIVSEIMQTLTIQKLHDKKVYQAIGVYPDQISVLSSKLVDSLLCGFHIDLVHQFECYFRTQHL